MIQVNDGILFDKYYYTFNKQFLKCLKSHWQLMTKDGKSYPKKGKGKVFSGQEPLVENLATVVGSIINYLQ